MGSVAGKYQIIADQGATFQRVLTWKDSANRPVALTGYTARMHIREIITSSTVVLSLTTSNGGITLGATDGTITLFISATATTGLIAKKYVYDLELVSPSGIVTRLVMGDFTVRGEVTR